MNSAQQTKIALAHTWPVFFARHGSFTPIQTQAIPLLLGGENALIIAPTASGKTEAVIAPLLERHALGPEHRRDLATTPELRILYICPTRALVRDLYERLRLPLERLGVSVAMKSGDTGPVSVSKPPTLLITTPESTDSLLTRAPRLLAPLRAVVLDEIHLFDNGPRGDHIRCLLRRIERVRRFHQQQEELDPTPLQRVALSATVPDPAGIAERYLVAEKEDDGNQKPVFLEKPGFYTRDQKPGFSAETPYTIVQAGEGRRIQADLVPMHGLDDLVTALTLRAGDRRVIRKSLVFCNTRNEVEQTAAYLRANLPYQAEIFVHYSNLDPAMRRAVEDGFAEASVALCVASSTLELGIDIGSVDDVVLMGPPPSLTSFLQRIGRGGRRTGRTQALCLARSPLENLKFRALLDLAQAGQDDEDRPRIGRIERIKTDEINKIRQFPSNPRSIHFPPDEAFDSTYLFRPSVLVQQAFSLLKQSPTGGVRLGDLRRVTPQGSGSEELNDDALRRILGNLVQLGYLRPGKLGEWRADQALDELADAHEIYSNIGADPLAITVVDAYSGRTIAQTSRIRLKGDTLLLGGRTLEVVWRDRYRLGVRPGRRGYAEEELRFQTAPFATPLEVGQAAAAHLGLKRDQICLLHHEGGALLFHFWGEIYGAWLAAILQAQFGDDEEPFVVTRRNEFCFFLPMGLTRLPTWDEALARRQLQQLLPRIGPYLETGRFHSLLPPGLANRIEVALCDPARFERFYRAAEIIIPPPRLRGRLRELL